MPTPTKKMLINVDGGETRIAVVSGNTLDNLHIEQTDENRLIGNIYYGKIVKVQPSFQAAFVDYGAERHGFLAFSDVSPQLIKSAAPFRGRMGIEKVLKVGQAVMVQVSRNELANKGASLTTNISLPGRFLVFMPNNDKGGVSKKIEDSETRTRLKHLLEGLCGEKDSAIIRTAGVNRSASELKRDFMVLRRKWNQILEKFENTASPQLLYEEEDVVVRTLRDYFIDDIAEIWLDHPEAFQRSREFFKAHIPTKQKRLQFYLGERSLFSDYGIENQIEQLSSNRVSLQSGGSLVIDPTEALVAIDVNSGRYDQGNKIEDTALRTNVEAAEEVARQLRLRNLGGLIVIDFIDMVSEENQNTVIQTLENSLQDDKAKWTLGGISQFGLLEMSRQRIANALSQETKTTCPTCGGLGEVLSVTSLASAVLRKIRDLAASGEVTEISGQVPVELFNYLFNKKRHQLDELEVEFGINIFLTANLAVESGKLPQFEVRYKKGATPIAEDPQRNRESKPKKAPSAPKPIKKDLPMEAEKETPSAEPSQPPRAAPSSAETTLKSASKPQKSKIIPLFSSVHQPPPTDKPTPPAKAEEPQEKHKEIPAGTVLFSSSHREPEPLPLKNTQPDEAEILPPKETPEKPQPKKRVPKKSTAKAVELPEGVQKSTPKAKELEAETAEAKVVELQEGASEEGVETTTQKSPRTRSTKTKKTTTSTKTSTKTTPRSKTTAPKARKTPKKEAEKEPENLDAPAETPVSQEKEPESEAGAASEKKAKPTAPKKRTPKAKPAPDDTEGVAPKATRAASTRKRTASAKKASE